MGRLFRDGERIFASGGYPESETVCLSADGEILWSNSHKTYEPSLLVAGGKLITVNDSGIAVCWNAENGDQLWRQRLGGNFSASPVLVNDVVIVPNLSGDTFVFKLGSEYQFVAKNRLGSDCYASPAVSDGQLFLRIGVGAGGERKEQVVCIAATEADDPASDVVSP